MGKYAQFGQVLILSVVLFTACRPTQVQLTDSKLKITGMYGLTISYADIEQIDTVAVLPRISMKTNGYALGKTLTGNFKLKDRSRVKLFVKKGFEPYLLIRSKGIVPVYINFENTTETIDLYNELSTKK